MGKTRMKLSGGRLKRSVLLPGMCLALAAKLAAQVDGSLKDLDLEAIESKTAIEVVAEENKALKEKLLASETSLSALQTNLAAANAETQIWRRKFTELNLRLEALGIEGASGNADKVGQRLLKAVSDIKLLEDERKQLREALISLSEAVLQFQKASETADPEARLLLEAAMRQGSKALGGASEDVPTGTPIASSLTDGRVISIKEDLGLVVANIGSRHGVRLGMPFQVIRDDKLIATLRVVDVREKIFGAVIQNLSDKEKIQVSDRLKVDAQP